MSRKVIVNGESICYLPPVNASEIQYDMGGGNYSNVQTELEGKVSKSGDEINGNLGIHRDSTTTEQGADTWLQLGNEIPTGTIGNSVGKIAIFGNGSKAVILQAVPDMTTQNRIVEFRDVSGQVAMLNEVEGRAGHYAQAIQWNTTTTINLKELGWDASRPILMYGGRGSNAFIALLTVHNGEYCVIKDWGAVQISSWTGATDKGVLTLTTVTGHGSNCAFNFIW